MAGLPLGDTRQHSPAVMLNVLGDIWFEGDAKDQPRTPDWASVAALPSARVHLYGKEEARVGRKMGHITFAGASLDEARDAAVRAAASLDIPLED